MIKKIEDWDVEFGSSFTRIYKPYPPYTFHVGEPLSETVVREIISFHNSAFGTGLVQGQKMKAQAIREALEIENS